MLKNLLLVFLWKFMNLFHWFLKFNQFSSVQCSLPYIFLIWDHWFSSQRNKALWGNFESVIKPFKAFFYFKFLSIKIFKICIIGKSRFPLRKFCPFKIQISFAIVWCSNFLCCKVHIVTFPFCWNEINSCL